MEKDGNFSIELSPEVAEGTYSNMVVIAHSTSEFVLDFVRMMPGLPKANVKSRIILTPEHAKRLLLALEENVSKYERENGEIDIKVNTKIPPMNQFNGGEA